MASPSLPESITDGVTTGHVTDHQNIHDLLNEFDQAAQASTKGDLLVYQDGLIKRLPVGSDDQVLTADAAETAGVKWATPSGGGGSGSFPGVYGFEFTGSEETRGRNGTGTTSGSYAAQTFTVNINAAGVQLSKILWDVFAADTYEVYFDGDLVDTQVVGGATDEVEFAFSAPLLVATGSYTVSLVPTTNQRYRFINSGGSFIDGWVTLGTWVEPGSNHGVPVQFVGVPPVLVELV